MPGHQQKDHLLIANNARRMGAGGLFAQYFGFRDQSGLLTGLARRNSGGKSHSPINWFNNSTIVDYGDQREQGFDIAEKGIFRAQCPSG